MKLSKVFKLAISSISASQAEYDQTPYACQFICIGIMQLANSGRVPGSDSYRAREVIKRRLGEHETLEDWVADSLAGKEYLASIRKCTSADGTEDREALAESFDKMQMTRINWLKSLSKEFAAIGD